ncbi:MAG: prolyl oligopeptidase family serine peptidase [Rhodopirellula sp.]|nr:prolyl oligopeptidase family serine peptidase [Rhodopirellula sp.]
MRRITRVFLSTILAWTATDGVQATSPIANLKAITQGGQVFLMWTEAETPPGTTFNVYMSEIVIADVARARRIAHHIEQHSARDWWADPASFAKDKPVAEPVGWLLTPGARRLDPAGGLFVHTVAADSRGKLYFAVTSTDRDGRENTQLAIGVNSLDQGVAAAAAPIQPIWQRSESPPTRGDGRGKAMWLHLHAKGGVVPSMEYLVFGDATMGWREGLPFKFSVRIQEGEVVVRPTDRVWINRPHTEAGDGGTPAIWTFWYGYNSNIFDRALMGRGVPTNYTERRNLWILDFVRDYYQPELNRWYCSGSSMGGCGTISFGFRRAELFAAVYAHVPIVSYTYLGRGSAWRLEPSCWTGPIPADLKTNEDVGLLTRMNGERFVRESQEDLPPVFLINGRQDASIPWQNNPPFYRALNDTRQGFAVYWDNGDHPGCGKDAPADVKAWAQRFRQFRRDESFPAFSNTSSNRNPGDGRPEDGDIVGWMNRGMDWSDVRDGPDRYMITVQASYPGIEYPVTTDATLRRLQQFRIRPGERLKVRVGDAPPSETEADGNGRLTIRGVAIPSGAGASIVVERTGGGTRSSGR